MKKVKSPAPTGNAKTTLLGDLQSIRALLELPESPLDDSADVPMLQDMVDSAFVVNESLLTSRATIDDGASGGRSMLSDATINALLGDEWRAAARQILADAQAAASSSGVWSQQQTQELAAAVMGQFDRTLGDWLVDLVRTRIDDLRARLLGVLEQQVAELTTPRANPDDHGK